MRWGKQHHSQGTQWRSTTQQRRRTAAPPKRREAHKGRGGKRHHPKEGKGAPPNEVGSQAVPPKSGGEGKNTTMIKPESFRQRVSSHIRGWRSLLLSCKIMHEAHGIVRLHVECWIQPSSRHCVPPRYHWRTRARGQWCKHSTRTMDGYRWSSIRMWTLPVASRGYCTCAHTSSLQFRDNMFKVISFSSHLERHIHVEERVFFFQKKKRCSSSPFALAVPSWFVVQFSFALSAKEQGWCVGFRLHLVATIVWRDIPSSWQKCWTIRDCHRQHYRRTWHHITLPLHSWTLPSHWQLTVSTFLRFSGSVNHHWNHWFPSSCSSLPPLFTPWSWLSGLIATTWRTEDLNCDSNPKIRLFFYEFCLAFCKVYNEISFEANGFFRLKKLDLSFTVHLRFITWFDLKLFWAFKFFRRLGGRCAGHLSPTSTDTVTHTYTHHAPQFLLFQCIFLFSILSMLAHFLSLFETFSEVYNVLQFADTFKHVHKQDTLCIFQTRRSQWCLWTFSCLNSFFQEKTKSSNQLFV